MEQEESDLSQSPYLACFFAYFETKQKVNFPSLKLKTLQATLHISPFYFFQAECISAMDIALIAAYEGVRILLPS